MRPGDTMNFCRQTISNRDNHIMWRYYTYSIIVTTKLCYATSAQMLSYMYISHLSWSLIVYCVGFHSIIQEGTTSHEGVLVIAQNPDSRELYKCVEVSEAREQERLRCQSVHCAFVNWASRKCPAPGIRSFVPTYVLLAFSHFLIARPRTLPH